MDIKPGPKRPTVQMNRGSTPVAANRQRVVGGVRRSPARQAVRRPGPAAKPQYRDEVDMLEDDILAETAEAVKKVKAGYRSKTLARRIMAWVYRVVGLVLVLALLAGLYMIYSAQQSGIEQINQRLDQIENQL